MFAKNMRLCLSNIIFKRQIHDNTSLIDNCIEVRNRNPRNLERLRIARKPDGYHLDRPIRSFWHKLEISKTTQNVCAEIIHCLNGPVISVSAKEWALKINLYRTYDSMAYVAVGRVLASRCLESGICEIFYSGKFTDKTSLLIAELEKSNIMLKEPSRYIHPYPWSLFRPEKPWETYE